MSSITVIIVSHDEEAQDVNRRLPNSHMTALTIRDLLKFDRLKGRSIELIIMRGVRHPMLSLSDDDRERIFINLRYLEARGTVVVS